MQNVGISSKILLDSAAPQQFLSRLVCIICRRSNNSGFSVGGGGGYGNAGPRIWFSPLDVFWYLDPYYMRRRRLRQESGQGMNFLEAIFSFVFGDGNPNESYEDRRWRLVRHT